MYLNNAATTYPKPDAVTHAVLDSLTRLPGDEGRSHGGNSDVERYRQRVAAFFGARESKFVCFAASGTDALNTAICGSVTNGDEVICTAFDHNSVARPLSHLARSHGIVLRQVGLEDDGSLNMVYLRNALSANTRALILTHVSNVTGAVTPLEDIAELLAIHRITLILDASQSAGLLPLDLATLPSRTILAAAAHKGLYGPSGTGILVVPDELVGQRLHGGTGVRSEDAHHPTDLPLRHEAGTLNHSGLAGLHAGLGFVLSEGIRRLAEQRSALVLAARERLAPIDGIELMPLPKDDGRAGIVAFRLRGISSDEVGFALDSAFSIQVRTGLHCAPATHRALGTFPDGLVRVSFGAFNRFEDVEALVYAITQVSRFERF